MLALCSSNSEVTCHSDDYTPTQDGCPVLQDIIHQIHCRNVINNSSSISLVNGIKFIRIR
jgi:hypothetical protein